MQAYCKALRTRIDRHHWHLKNLTEYLFTSNTFFGMLKVVVSDPSLVDGRRRLRTVFQEIRRQAERAVGRKAPIDSPAPEHFGLLHLFPWISIDDRWRNAPEYEWLNMALIVDHVLDQADARVFSSAILAKADIFVTSDYGDYHRKRRTTSCAKLKELNRYVAAHRSGMLDRVYGTDLLRAMREYQGGGIRELSDRASHAGVNWEEACRDGLYICDHRSFLDLHRRSVKLGQTVVEGSPEDLWYSAVNDVLIGRVIRAQLEDVTQRGIRLGTVAPDYLQTIEPHSESIFLRYCHEHTDHDSRRPMLRAGDSVAVLGRAYWPELQLVTIGVSSASDDKARSQYSHDELVDAYTRNYSQFRKHSWMRRSLKILDDPTGDGIHLEGCSRRVDFAVSLQIKAPNGIAECPPRDGDDVWLLRDASD